MRIGITGTTGSVGIRLCEIAIEQGHDIVGLVRDPDREAAQQLIKLGVRLVQGDLGNEASLREVARGVDAFFHLAGQVGDWGSRRQFEEVNVGGTSRAIEAAAAEKVKRFVFLSSVAVYGHPKQGIITEEWPTRHGGRPYDDTKCDAERLVFSRGCELGLEVVSIRAPIIYGPHDGIFLPRMVEALRRERFPLINDGRSPLNLVWVDHVVDVMLLAGQRDHVAGEAFNVMDEVDVKPPSVREIVEVIAREAGVPLPKRSIPYPIALAIGYLAYHTFALVRAQKPPPITQFVVMLFTRDVIYNSSKAVRLLGWKPRLSSLEGIARFAREMRQI